MERGKLNRRKNEEAKNVWEIVISSLGRFVEFAKIREKCSKRPRFSPTPKALEFQRFISLRLNHSFSQFLQLLCEKMFYWLIAGSTGTPQSAGVDKGNYYLHLALGRSIELHREGKDTVDSLEI
jgi:hypothetical protein